jgi:hypothetical protein
MGPFRIYSHFSHGTAVAAALACTACSDDREVDAAPDVSVMDAGHPGADGGVNVRGTVIVDTDIEWLDGGVIRGARMCLVDHPEVPCAFPTPAGPYRMELPVWDPPQKLALNVTAPGLVGGTYLLDHSPWRFPGGSLLTVSLDFNLEDETRTAAKLRQAGLRYPALDRAVVMLDVTANTPDLLPTGATVRINPPAGAEAVYMNDYEIFDRTQRGLGRTGMVLFGEVLPGPFEVTVPGCELLHVMNLWAGKEPNTLGGTAVAGSVTYVNFMCLGTAR